MKKTIKYTLIIIFSFSIFISSCHQRIEIDTKYDNLNRVVGPEGDTINYYEYNPLDSISEVIVRLEVPPNALDSFVVFNMYEFSNEAIDIDLLYMGMENYSDFLYFVPFYESEGYNEYTTDSIDHHLSIEFNIPVTITYNLSFYEIGYNAKLYKIKIPKINEWGGEYADNVWVNWNYQGYPEGYDPLDLTYIINGRWTEYDAWGAGDFSFANWEEVTYYNYDITNQKVTFNIQNTDYMYVMAGIIEK